MKMLQKELYRHISMFHFYTPTKTPESISMHTQMKFSIKDFFSKWPDPQETTNLVAFTAEILNGKLHFYAVFSGVSVGV